MKFLVVALLGLFGFIGYQAISVRTLSNGRPESPVVTASDVPSPSPAPVSRTETAAATPLDVASSSTPLSLSPGVPATQVERRDEPVERATASGSSSVVQLSMSEAAQRISSVRGHPSVVLLYATTCPLSQRMFADYVALAEKHSGRGVEFLALSTDDQEDMEDIPDFLASRHANFAPLFIKPWQSGQLISAMGSLGIRVQSTWTRPLIAVRDANGRVVTQGEGVTDLRPVEQALARLQY